MSVVQNNAAKAVTKSMGLFGGLGLAFNIINPALVYSESKKQGDSNMMAAGKAAFEFAAWQVMPGVMFGKLAADVLPGVVGGIKDVAKANQANVNRQYKANFGGYYQDTQQAATMRQAGMYSMNQSKGSIQQSLGVEAKSYYRRNNTSMY